MLKYIVIMGAMAICHLSYAEMSEKCRRPPKTDTHPLLCCDVPKIMSDEDLAECGPLPGKPMGGAPKVPPSCDADICMLKKHDFLTADDKIDKAAVTKFLENYASTHPDMSSTVDYIKANCLEKELKGPADFCEPIKLRHCFSRAVLMNCNNWMDTPDCAIIKKFQEDCRQEQMDNN